MKFWKKLMFLGGLFFATSTPVKANEYEESLKRQLSVAIDSQHLDFKHDFRRAQKALGQKIGTLGREHTGFGETGIAEITTERSGTGLKQVVELDAKIPWKGRWILKNWHGTGYDREHKDTSGVYHLRIRVHLLGGRIEYLANESLTPLGHDSKDMPHRAIDGMILDEDRLRRILFEG